MDSKKIPMAFNMAIQQDLKTKTKSNKKLIISWPATSFRSKFPPTLRVWGRVPRWSNWKLFPLIAERQGFMARGLHVQTLLESSLPQGAYGPLFFFWVWSKPESFKNNGIFQTSQCLVKIPGKILNLFVFFCCWQFCCLSLWICYLESLESCVIGTVLSISPGGSLLKALFSFL